jgi:histidinol-phosphate phosphatase family protein
MIKTAFLDRDGVININTNYPGKIEDIKFTPFFGKLFQKLLDKKYKQFIIVTNQSGIGRGYYAINNLIDVQNYIYKKIKDDFDIDIKATFFCPFHKDAKFNMFKTKEDENGIIYNDQHIESVEIYNNIFLSPYRKPSGGMILDGCKIFNVDKNNSIMIGDSRSDLDSGVNAKLGKSMLVDLFVNSA